MRPCMVPRRPATSARMAAWYLDALAATSADTRSKSRTISGSWLMVDVLSEGDGVGEGRDGRTLAMARCGGPWLGGEGGVGWHLRVSLACPRRLLRRVAHC